MVNQGSPNPSSLVVNLTEDIRQRDPTKLHVTTHNKEDDAGGEATYNQTAINGNASGVIVSKAVALNKLLHLSGIKAGGEADGKFTLRIAGQNKLTLRNSAAEPTVGQQFQPPIKVTENQVVEILGENLNPVAFQFEASILGWEENLV